MRRDWKGRVTVAKSNGRVSLILVPHPDQAGRLGAAYAQAIKEAVELYVASAYLTNWLPRPRVGKHCSKILFLVGTDFGLTRKHALRNLLQWRPNHGACQVLAVGGGFHPKILAWKTGRGQYRCIVGSSNLSKAAFSDNFEANVLMTVARSEYDAIVGWLESVAIGGIHVTPDWIKHHYREARLRGKGGSGGHLRMVALDLPEGVTYRRAVRERRKQQASFGEIEGKVRADVGKCAKGSISRREFWDRFWETWSGHSSRFQGGGLQISGKAANWREVCASLARILQARKSSSVATMDDLVSREIDALDRSHNPARGAWLSEMLCHFFPRMYPVKNGPIETWLSLNNWKGRRGATEGQHYVELSQQLRHSITRRPAGARNLAELDHAIWLWVENRSD